MLLETKTIKNSNGITVLNSDEYLRNSIENLIEVVKKQRMTFKVNEDQIAEHLTKRLEPALKVDINKIMTTTTLKAEKDLTRSYNQLKSYSETIKADAGGIYVKTNEINDKIENITKKTGKLLGVFTAVMFVMIIALITLSMGAEIVSNIYDWTRLNEGITLAYKHFFNTSGWGYLGWALVLLGFIMIQIGVLFGFFIGLYKLTKKVLDS